MVSTQKGQTEVILRITLYDNRLVKMTSSAQPDVIVIGSISGSSCPWAREHSKLGLKKIKIHKKLKFWKGLRFGVDRQAY